MSLNDRADGPLPGLDATAVRRLAGGWSGVGLWEDVALLAARFWSAPDDGNVVEWHHLVLAVGNFKRDAGRRLHPARLPPSPAVKALARPREFVVPGPGPAVDVQLDDPATWQALSKGLRGAAVATTTTLLAALWPDEHFIFDWRVRAAANGLRIAVRRRPTPGVVPEESSARPPNFTDYKCVRAWLQETVALTGEPLLSVERALYELSRKVPMQRGRSWRDYGDVVRSRLD